jgi:hypothetical protein
MFMFLIPPPDTSSSIVVRGAVDVGGETWLIFGHGRLLKRPPARLKLCAVVKIIPLLPKQVRVAVIR